MRKIAFLILGLCFGFVAIVAGADTYKMADGGSVTGEVVKFDDSGIMLHLSDDSYTNVTWAQFSQDGLQQLSQNAKIKPLVEPFIEPTQSSRPPKPQISVRPVDKLELPADRSILGGFLKSPLGLFIILLVYAANLVAGYEISLVKARPAAQVVGVCAVLPIIGPVIFLCRPMLEEAAVTEASLPPEQQFPEGEASPEQIQVVEAAAFAKEEESRKKLEPQIYARGKFTFNKRFVETKFASYLGDGKSGDAAKFTMELRTAKEVFIVERIMQVAAAELILETNRGQVTVPLTEIQEIKLNPKI